MAQIVDIPVRGMTCAACVARVQKAATSTPGVTDARVNLATERATVTLEPGAQAAAVLASLRKRGYEPVTAALDVPDTVARVRAALATEPGVIEIAATPGGARVTYLPTRFAPAELQAFLRDAGVTFPGVVEPGDPAQAARDLEASELRRDVVMALALAWPLFVFGMLHMSVPAVADWVHAQITMQGAHILMFALATAVQLGPGLRLATAGARALWARSPDMNSLVLLGTGSAWLWSTLVTFRPGWVPVGSHAVYFEGSATVIALVLLGRHLELRARGRAGLALRALGQRMPRRARVRRGLDWVEVDSAWLQVDDVVQVRAGEAFGVDGAIVSGQTLVDNSMLTGEPIPVPRGVGDAVAAGTLNQLETVEVRAQRTGRTTTIARIAEAVATAQASRPPVQRLADAVVERFVPGVLFVAAVTLLVWVALLGAPGLGVAIERMVAVLVIACPCAMGLATPISVLVGTGRAAELGVVFTDGAALERLAGVDVVAFDKTGTLTEGRPTVLETTSLDDDRWLSLAAGAENTSLHPLAQAVVSFAAARGLHVPDATEGRTVVGAGVTARVDGHEVRVGRPDWIGVDAAKPDQTELIVEVDGRVAGRLWVSDPLRASAPEAVAALHAAGVSTRLLSGDAAGPVERVASALGIARWEARCTPQTKADAVARAQQDGARVAFVGDGVNDAPAIAQADVGVAMGTGTDVAIGSAQVVLVSGDPSGVARARSLARATLQNIRWNLGWAFGYNIVLIPLAAGVFVPIWPDSGLSPVLAGLAMSLSSVFVVSNALRLRGFGRR